MPARQNPPAMPRDDATPPRIRPATRDDLPRIVALLADDPLGALREDPGPPLPAAYAAAFDAIARDPHTELVVAEDAAGQVIGTLQLTCVPNLTLRGAWRGLVEGVHVDRHARGQRIGEALMHWAIERARGRGCRLVQLTSNLKRADAIRFYERLGFVASHAGLKLMFDEPEAGP